MNTFTFGNMPGSRDLLAKHLENAIKQVLDAYDSGQEVSLHSHNEYSEEMDMHRRVVDLCFEGWTFGVSIGKYPAKK